MFKFSVIIPVYNVKKYLPKCLDSLSNQTYSNIEIICINDGSTDSSLQILEEYAQKDNRIKIINQENQGVSVARNNGIDSSMGDYILFVDADDWIDTKTCEIISKATTDGYDLISFNAYYVKGNNRQQAPIKNNSNIFNSEMWSICYKKNFLNKYNIRFPQGIKIAEDHIFKVQTLIQSQNIKFLDEYLYYYFSRGNSSTKVNSIVNDDIQSYFYITMQDWFRNAGIIKQSTIYNFWLKLVGGTLLNVGFKNVNMQELNNFINHTNNINKNKLNNIRILKLFIFLNKIHLFNIYRKLIRPIGKHCIVLPYRRFKSWQRSKNG